MTPEHTLSFISTCHTSGGCFLNNNNNNIIIIITCRLRPARVACHAGSDPPSPTHYYQNLPNLRISFSNNSLSINGGIR